MRSIIVFALAASVGCGFFGSGSQTSSFAVEAVCASVYGLTVNTTGPVQAGCTKIEGADIGRAGIEVSIDGDVVRIVDWREKDDSRGEFIGFTFESNGPVVYGVKAGSRSFAGTDRTWVHSDGTGGPRASGISNITFCPGDPEGGDGDGGDGDGGGGGGGECPNGGGDGATCPPDVEGCGGGTSGGDGDGSDSNGDDDGDGDGDGSTGGSSGGGECQPEAGIIDGCR